MAETTIDSINVTLANMCTELASTLLSSKCSFKFNLRINKGFNFYLSSECEPSNPQNKEKKKKSPCVIRRDKRRKQEYLERKLESSSQDPATKDHSCDVCDYICADKVSLNRHIYKEHKSISQVDGADSPFTRKPPDMTDTTTKVDTSEKGIQVEVEMANTEEDCPISNCDQNFKNKNELEKHMNLVSRSLHYL